MSHWPAGRGLAGLLRRGRGLHLRAPSPAYAAAPLELPAPPRLLLPLPAGALEPDLVPGTPLASGAVLVDARDASHMPLRAPLPATYAGTVRAAGQACVLLLPEPSAARESWVFAPLEQPWEPAALVERVRQCGLGGQGGAGFPTWLKLRAACAAPLHTLVVNAVECEPGLSSDAAALRESGADLAPAARTLAACLGVTAAVLAARRAVHAELAWPGPRLIADERYPGGDERELLRRLDATPLAAGQRPTDVGVLVLNAATVLAVAAAAQGWLPARRLVSVHGTAVPRPAVVRAWLGTPVATLLAALGVDAAGLLLREGGPMMGRVLVDAQAPITWRSTGLLVEAAAPRGADPVCIRCGLCEPVCPAGLQPQRLWAAGAAPDGLALARAEGVLTCTGCACCDAVCPSHLPLARRFATQAAAARQDDDAERRARRARERFARHERRRAERAERRQRSVHGGWTALPAGDSTATDTAPPGNERAATVAAIVARARRRRDGER